MPLPAQGHAVHTLFSLDMDCCAATRGGMRSRAQLPPQPNYDCTLAAGQAPGYSSAQYRGRCRRSAADFALGGHDARADCKGCRTGRLRVTANRGARSGDWRCCNSIGRLGCRPSRLPHQAHEWRLNLTRSSRQDRSTFGCGFHHSSLFQRLLKSPQALKILLRPWSELVKRPCSHTSNSPGNSSTGMRSCSGRIASLQSVIVLINS